MRPTVYQIEHESLREVLRGWPGGQGGVLARYGRGWSGGVRGSRGAGFAAGRSSGEPAGSVSVVSTSRMVWTSPGCAWFMCKRTTGCASPLTGYRPTWPGELGVDPPTAPRCVQSGRDRGATQGRRRPDHSATADIGRFLSHVIRSPQPRPHHYLQVVQDLV
jgi:hypothetical protein